MKNDLLQVLDAFEITEGDKIYAKMPSLASGVWEIRDEAVTVGIPWQGFDTNVLKGEYIVTHACLTGGGTGHGPADVYPDGWQVTAERVGNPNLKINFYQTGSFTAMIPKKTPIGVGKAQGFTIDYFKE